MGMSCDTMEVLLSAYIDGEVTAEERQTVEQHVAHCESCRVMLQDFSTAQTLVRTLPTFDAPQGFRQRVTERIERTSRIWFRVRQFAPRFALGTVVLLMISAGVLFWHLQQAPQNQTEQYAASIEVYAEDILFEDVSTTTDVLFSTDTDGVAEEILDMINIGTTETRQPSLRYVGSNRGIA
jgi:anti-sigma factor RsiW